MNTQTQDLKNILLEVLADSRYLALLQYFRRLPRKRQNLLIRLARNLK